VGIIPSFLFLDSRFFVLILFLQYNW
jgi:hypothetical protein